MNLLRNQPGNDSSGSTKKPKEQSKWNGFITAIQRNFYDDMRYVYVCVCSFVCECKSLKMHVLRLFLVHLKEDKWESVHLFRLLAGWLTACIYLKFSIIFYFCLFIHSIICYLWETSSSLC